MANSKSSNRTFLFIGNAEGTRKVHTVDAVVDHLGHGWHQRKVLFFCGLIVLASSMQTFLISFLAPALQCEWYIPDVAVALLSSADSVGMVVFSPLTGYLSDVYGRRTCLLLTTALWGFASALSSFSTQPFWMLVLRFLMGGGLSSYVQAYPYAMENLPSSSYSMLTLLKMMWALGGLVCTFVSIFMLHFLPWGWLVLLTSSSALFICFLLLWLRESPKFYEITNQTDELLLTLNSISRTNNTPLPQGLVSISPDGKEKRGNWADLFNREQRRCTIIFSVLHLVAGVLYFGLVYLAVIDLEEIMRRGVSAEKCVRCLPCPTIRLSDASDVIWSSVGELIANPIAYLLVTQFGEKIILLGLSSSAVIVFVTLPFTGFYYSFRIIVSRMLAAAIVILCFTTSPMYFKAGNRGIAAGLFNLWFRCGAIVAPFLVQVLLRENATMAITLFVMISAVACIASACLPNSRPVVPPVNND